MNFYKHHLGDYAAATSHLSWDEDCAYRRLLDAYYKREAPLPAEVRDTCRLVRASTGSQRRAVEDVLREFFSLKDDGWHQKRCDEEIGAATAQAETNRRIAEKREADRRARIEHESLSRKQHEPLHESSTPPIGEREPSQTPDSRLQTPEKRQEPLSKSARSAKRCPLDFAPEPEMQMLARSLGVDFTLELAKFRDHTFATSRSDWPATFRNWLRNAKPAPAKNGAQSFRERDEQLAAEKHRRWTSSASTPAVIGEVIDMEEPDAARIGHG